MRYMPGRHDRMRATMSWRDALRRLPIGDGGVPAPVCRDRRMRATVRRRDGLCSVRRRPDRSLSATVRRRRWVRFTVRGTGAVLGMRISDQRMRDSVLRTRRVYGSVRGRIRLSWMSSASRGMRAPVRGGYSVFDLPGDRRMRFTVYRSASYLLDLRVDGGRPMRSGLSEC